MRGPAWRSSVASPASINRGNSDYADFADFADRSSWHTALLMAARGSIGEIREIVVQLLGFTGRDALDPPQKKRSPRLHRLFFDANTPSPET